MREGEEKEGRKEEKRRVRGKKRCRKGRVRDRRRKKNEDEEGTKWGEINKWQIKESQEKCKCGRRKIRESRKKEGRGKGWERVRKGIREDCKDAVCDGC